MPPRPDPLDPTQPFYEFARALRDFLEEQHRAATGVENLLWSKLPAGAPKRWLRTAALGQALLPRQHLDVLLAWREVSPEWARRLRRAWRSARASQAMPAPASGVIDVVGIGALNVDHVATSSQSPGIVATPAADISGLLENKRFAESEQEIDDRLASVDSVMFTHRLGGSAFNTLRILAGSGACRTGFVGVAGRPPTSADLGDETHATALSALGCDASRVRTVKATAGRTVSVVVQREGRNDRDLTNWPGANDQIDHLLEEQFDEIVAYLCSARVAHVSSFSGLDTMDTLADILDETVRRSPHTIVSFDPSFSSAKQFSEPIEKMLSVTSLLFVNQREFEHLVEHYVRSRRVPATRLAQGEALRGLLREGGMVVVLEHAESATIFSESGMTTVQPQHATEQAVEDSTGAGDVFVAGFLLARLATRVTAHSGAVLGMHFVEQKVAHGTALTPEAVSAAIDALRCDVEAT